MSGVQEIHICRIGVTFSEESPVQKIRSFVWGIRNVTKVSCLLLCMIRVASSRFFTADRAALHENKSKNKPANKKSIEN